MLRHQRPEFFHHGAVEVTGGFWPGGSSDRYSAPPSSSLKVRLASSTTPGLLKHSTIDAAITLAPATAPLWAIDVASATPAAQW